MSEVEQEAKEEDNDQGSHNSLQQKLSAHYINQMMVHLLKPAMYKYEDQNEDQFHQQDI